MQRVLIAERDSSMQACLRFLMEREGFTVQVVGDGEAALAAITATQPDLALVAVDLEKRDGYDLCQCCRADPDLASMKILMVTAKARAVDRDKGLALGADDYLGKPFANTNLVAKVRALLASGAGC